MSYNFAMCIKKKVASKIYTIHSKILQKSYPRTHYMISLTKSQNVAHTSSAHVS